MNTFQFITRIFFCCENKFYEEDSTLNIPFCSSLYYATAHRYTDVFNFPDVYGMYRSITLDGVRGRTFINERIIPGLLTRQNEGQRPQFNLGNLLKLAVSILHNDSFKQFLKYSYPCIFFIFQRVGNFIPNDNQ